MYYYRGGVFLEGGRNTHTNSNKRNKQEHRKRYCGLHIQKWKMYHCTELSFLSINESSLRKNPVGYNPLFFFFFPNSLYRFDSFSQYVSKAVLSTRLEGIQLLNHLFSSAVQIYCISLVIFSNRNILCLSS